MDAARALSAILRSGILGADRENPVPHPDCALLFKTHSAIHGKDGVEETYAKGDAFQLTLFHVKDSSDTTITGPDGVDLVLDAHAAFLFNLGETALNKAVLQLEKVG